MIIRHAWLILIGLMVVSMGCLLAVPVVAGEVTARWWGIAILITAVNLAAVFLLLKAGRMRQ